MHKNVISTTKETVMRLLLAEDEKELSKALSVILKHSNYSVDTVNNGIDALDYGLTGSYDGIILDIMMPGKDGLEVLSELRAAEIDTPILMLTAKSTVEDRIEGLNLGADDYLIKPFDTGELLARVRAMTRRKAEYTPNILEIGNVTLNRENSELSASKDTIRLTNKEFQMLEMLMENPNMLISTERFLERIWGLDTDSEINVVWTYISTLRKKLGNVGANVQIKASRGSGYTLEEFDLDAADQPE